MLNGIPRVISPELIKVLMEMGHGDEIVLADANYPAKSYSNHVISYSGVGIYKLLEAILELFPLDTYTEKPVCLMNLVDGETYIPAIWEEYGRLLNRYGIDDYKIEYLARETFYERSKKVYCIVATGEEALYANVILKKGVVM